MKIMKRGLKIVGFGILGIIILIVLVVGFLLIKNYIDSQKPWLENDYYTQFQSDSELEKKYAGLGNYEISSKIVKSEDKTIGNIRIWYPSEMENKQAKYPLIVVTNASNMAALNYEPYFERLASWGFVVVGNDDRQAGTGISTSQTLDYILEQNQNSDSVFYGKIDTQNIGITGYSQGGAGATGSAAYAYIAQMWGGYDASKVSIPWFMTGGTGTSDSKEVSDVTKEMAGIAPLSSLVENYNAASDNVFKLRARVVGAEHEEMQIKTDGYMTAWMLYQLQGDEEAGKALIGENAEILNNANWQDIEKNN